MKSLFFSTMYEVDEIFTKNREQKNNQIGCFFLVITNS